MNNKTIAAIIAADIRAEQAEARALETQIELALTRRRLIEIEDADEKRKGEEAESAVRRLVSRGVIKQGEAFTTHEWKSKFLTDPALIPLCLCKPFNRKVSKA